MRKAHAMSTSCNSSSHRRCPDQAVLGSLFSRKEMPEDKEVATFTVTWGLSLQRSF